MTDLPERAVASKFPAGLATDLVERDTIVATSEQKACRTGKSSLWSSLFSSNFSVFESHSSPDSSGNKINKSRNNGWRTAVRRILTRSAMRRLQERLLAAGVNPENDLTAFLEDFSSRIWMTYRKGFDAIGDSRFTSDVGWGCMIRSSQMLVAQALLCHRLGRSWRKPLQKPYDPDYIHILHLFGDSEACAFSIHNLLQAGRGYGLAAGAWLGPYAMCRTWETLARIRREQAEGKETLTMAVYIVSGDEDGERGGAPVICIDVASNLCSDFNNAAGAWLGPYAMCRTWETLARIRREQAEGKETLTMAVYIVSGDEDGERGGAPVICIDVASNLCSDFNNGEVAWAPILLLVPLVLGLEKVNPRYIPLLRDTFTFPQSLGILGGKPGASTYLVGVQDDKALYLDPHEVQPVVEIKSDNLEADVSSYHCSTVRNLPLDQIDPSLAIGFYCRDEDDFKDFCLRASELSERSNGAPLFTVTQSLNPTRQAHDPDTALDRFDEPFNVGNSSDGDGHGGEDDWQLL
ncbi:uncharacterized protein A4U43_C01F9050 [Asparagus officinalis]|uniref:Cysteine protease n=1 Tax=Asparagus officinalis TaxID=4686 RepID=A0A5P1FSP6_ASPOF|nr:uncharacterized protein A4U43_C01F9050 [Asparagus officinalis]